MNAPGVLEMLESELRGFPERSPSGDLYRHVLAEAERVKPARRGELADALRAWIELHAEPRTMIAIYVAQALKLTELRPELQRLRADVIAGRAFLPYYVQWVDEALAELGTAGP
jgi:hypothetical protein